MLQTALTASLVELDPTVCQTLCWPREERRRGPCLFAVQEFTTPRDKYRRGIYCLVPGRQKFLFSNPDCGFLTVVLASSMSLSLTLLLYEMSKEGPNGEGYMM